MSSNRSRSLSLSGRSWWWVAPVVTHPLAAAVPARSVQAQAVLHMMP